MPRLWLRAHRAPAIDILDRQLQLRFRPFPLRGLTRGRFGRGMAKTRREVQAGFKSVGETMIYSVQSSKSLVEIDRSLREPA